MRVRIGLMGLAIGALLAMGGNAKSQEAGGGGRGPAIIAPRPVPPPGWTYRWVPPAYQTVVDRVWVAGRTDMVPEWMETSPGRWEQVWRQVTVPGHWEDRTRQVVVREGYWELVRIQPPRPVPPVFVPVPRPGATVGVEGYKSGDLEDLSKFSPLWDWPEKK